MSTFSDKFSNHWKCIPYAMATLTSSDGFMVLFHLLRRGYTNENKTTCTISNKELAEVMGTSVSSIRRAIETLKKLNLIGCFQNKGTLCTFFINWDEIQAIHKISSQISDKGWVYLRGLCVNGEVRPISAIPMDILNDVVRQYPHTSLNMNTPSLNMSTPSLNMSGPPQIDEEKDESIEKLSENIDYKQPNLAQYEQGCVQYEQGCAHIEQQNKIYIENKEKEKENNNERSELNKEANKKILEWFNSRDLSLPEISYSNFETILENPDFADTDFDMAVRQVWGYLQYDEDSADNYIPAEYFKDILYRAWNDLKTDNPAFSLSEQDMKNIFGFELEMKNGEIVCYITPSKIKDITTPLPTSRKIKRKGAEDRLSRFMFIESLVEVGQKDVGMLTDAEYAIWLMIEFVKERENKQQPRPSEVTKMVYEELLERFSQESGIPVEELKTLWKELPQKSMVKLHPQQLSVEKIINYNVRANQASDVEDVYNRKMAKALS